MIQGEEINGVDLQSLVLPVVRREHAQFRFTVFRKGGKIDDLSDRIDLTNATAHLSVKKNAANATIEISKISTAPTEILIDPTQTIGAATRGQYTVFILPTDFTAPTLLSLGLHVFDTWIEDTVLGNHAVARGQMPFADEYTEIP